MTANQAQQPSSIIPSVNKDDGHISFLGAKIPFGPLIGWLRDSPYVLTIGVLAWQLSVANGQIAELEATIVHLRTEVGTLNSTQSRMYDALNDIKYDMRDVARRLGITLRGDE